MPYSSLHLYHYAGLHAGIIRKVHLKYVYSKSDIEMPDIQYNKTAIARSFRTGV